MNTVWAGLSIGSIYALVAIAYNIVFLSSGVFNFAQAQFLMLGTFVAYTATMTLGLPVYVVIPAAVLLGALLGLVEEFTAIRPLQGLGVHGELVTTLGVAVLLDGVAIIIWGSQPLPVPFFGSQGVLTIFSGRILPAELTLIGLACAVAVGAELFSRRTDFGLTGLATAEDRVASMLRGINVRSHSLISFGLAGALCMALGPFVAPKTFASFDLGVSLALKGFVALAIGGFGSQKGALIGGLVAGLVEAMAARYFGVSYQNIAIFALLLFVLMIRPIGLFGEREQRQI